MYKINVTVVFIRSFTEFFIFVLIRQNAYAASLRLSDSRLKSKIINETNIYDVNKNWNATGDMSICI